MKKFIKFCALTGLILLLLGIGITSVSASLGGRFSSFLPRRIWARIWDDDMDDYWADMEYSDSSENSGNWSHWNEEGLHNDGQPPADTSNNNSVPGVPDNSPQEQGAYYNTRKLDIDMDNGVLRIYEKEGISQIEINVYDKYDATRCYMDEETLKIKRENTRHRAEDIKVEVLVPQDYQFEKISVDMGAAECRMDGLHTSKLDIDTGVGAVTFNGTVTGNVELETGVGDVTLNLTGSESDYNYKIECGVGSIRVGDSRYTTLSHENHINNNAPYTMELECGVGNITVSFDGI